MYRYEVMKIQSLFALHNSYGIICREDQGELWPAVAIVAPFSSDLDTITRLAEKCTALQLSPDHLVDVSFRLHFAGIHGYIVFRY